MARRSVSGALAVAPLLLAACHVLTPAHPDPYEIWGGPKYPASEQSAEPSAQEAPVTEQASEPERDQPPPGPPSGPEHQPTAPPTEETKKEEGVLETTRRGLRWTTEWLATGVDSWFGDKPFWEAGGEVKDGQLSIGLLKRQGETIEAKVRFNARLRLPNLEQRAYLFIGRDNEREVVADTPGAFSRQDRLLSESRDDRSFFTGLGFALRDNIDLRLGFHGIKPYAQARYRERWFLTWRDLMEFRQTFFWRINERFGSTTAFSYEHAVNQNTAVRWLSSVTISQQTEEFDWSSVVGTYKSFGDPRLLSLELSISGRLASGVAIGEYGFQTKWQQPIYRDWLIGEFQIGYFWPRPDRVSERDQRWALGFTTTMRF